MSAKIVAFVNNKGGVGKTTSVANIGYYLALQGRRVLLVDVDPQANLTATFLEKVEGRTMYDAFTQGKGLPVVEIAQNLSLAPSHSDLSGGEFSLSTASNREYVLKNILRADASRYDVVLLDAPPSLGLLTINALTAANSLVVPLTAEGYSFKGLGMIEEALSAVRVHLNKGLKVDAILLTSWENRRVNKIVENTLRDLYGDRVLPTKIRRNIALVESSLNRESIFTYGPQTNGACDYREAAESLIAALHL